MIRTNRSPWIFLLALLAAANARAAELHGTVLENEIGGTPMVGVQIKAAGSNPTASKNLGSFKLVLPNRKAGETVSLTVSKEGYRVVNDIQLETMLPLEPASRPLTLLLCKPAACEEMRRRFYRLKGMEAVEASYQRQLLELERRNQATAAERDRLKQERDSALAAAEKAAEELARTRPEESSEMYQKALRLFLEGRVSEALVILDEAKLQASLEAARSRKAEAEREIEQAVRGYLLRGQILTSQFDFAAAERAYRTAAETAPENLIANFALAHFLTSQKRYTEATAAYGACLNLARKHGDAANLGGMLNNLGTLLSDQNRKDEARKAFDEALETYRQLVVTDPEFYHPYLATTLNNLGHLLHDQHRWGEAQKAYDEALEIRRQLAVTSPEVYLPNVATTVRNLGNLLRDKHLQGEARKAFDDALELRRQLAEKSPGVYLPDLATTLNDLGLLEIEENPAAARQTLNEALEIRKQLVSAHGGTFAPDLAATFLSLAGLHMMEKRLEEAREALLGGLKALEPLALENPEAFQGKVEAIQGFLKRLAEVEESP